MMECNNVLDANVMVNTCSITETKGWKRSIRVCLEQHIRNTVLNIMLRLTKPLMAGNAKPYNMMGKYGRVGSLMLYGSGVGEGRRWENTGVGSKREEEKKRVSGEPGVLYQSYPFFSPPDPRSLVGGKRGKTILNYLS